MSHSKLDTLLAKIDNVYITVKDYTAQFDIFKNVFDVVFNTMKEQDNYFQKYCKGMQYAGSFYDGIKIGEMDEFDCDVVVTLPIDYNNIEIQNATPGFVTLNVRRGLDQLGYYPDRGTDRNIITRWCDGMRFLTNTNFSSWVGGIVNNALSRLDNRVVINGKCYLLSVTKSGPAFTINCKEQGNSKTVLDVDIVPVLRFSSDLWPNGYRRMILHVQNKDYWLATPKPSKNVQNPMEQSRLWAVSFHEQEREYINGCNQLKPTVKLLKKLRDTLQIRIKSYSIKTLFLWEVERKGKEFWNNSPAILFKHMLQKLHNAIAEKNLPDFWDSKYNLLGGIDAPELQEYKSKLGKLLSEMDNNNNAAVVRALLLGEELQTFMRTREYQTCA